mmetsp:Transcript_28967/g.55472  ORF Transcript_28967/g.55472 Transcript_28967/m.55472 type:complete len:263 (-) Transcript_28967:2060-2848(-)
MLQRFSQIGGVYYGHVSQDRVQIVQRQSDRRDGRRAVQRKGGGDVLDLGKGTMRVQHVEGGKTGLPILKAAHHEKAGGGADAKGSSAPLGYMATAALGIRHRLACNRVTGDLKRDNLDRFFGWRAKNRRAFGGKRQDCTRSDLGVEPVGKAVCPFGVTSLLKMPNGIQPRKERCAFGSQYQISSFSRIHDFDPNLGFQRKARLDMLHQPAFDQRRSRIKRDLPVFGPCKAGQQRHNQNNQNAHGHRLGSPPAFRQRQGEPHP